MSVNTNLKAAGLMHTGGLMSIAAALALAIVPTSAMAQERGKWQGGGQQSAQSQRGGNGGGAWRGNRSGGEGGRAAVRTDRGGGDAMRGREVRAQRQVQSNPQGNPGWTNRARPQDNQVARARIEAGERQRAEIARQAQAQREVRRDGQQWSGRNRTYADQDRNRTYRQGWRDGNRNDSVRDRQDQRQSYRNGWRDGNRNDSWRDRRDERQAYRQGWRDNNRWDRNWRNDNRYDWRGYRNLNRNHYRLGRYYAPYRGYSYRRVGIGFSLAPLFFGSNYWINDPWSYRLPAAYGGTRWIRYYDDALLVDTYSGEVIDVIENFFW